MKRKPTFSQRLKYAFDNTLASGSSAIIAWLAIISAILVIVFGVIYVVTGLNMPDAEGMGFFEALWQALMRSVDPGTVAGDEGWGFRLVGLLITISGIFILSTLIGILTTGLESKLEDLRKGRSLVLESDHSLIMGWSDKIFYIIEQLIIANENKKKARIVILAPRDKAAMEDEIKARIPDTKTTRIICRTGSPLILDDIEIVNPDDARSIIILSPENENPDIYTIKSVLALTNNPDRKPEPYHIVAELDDNENMEAARLVGQGEVCYVRSSDLLAKIAAQTCRQSGLSMIYADLLDYSGDEIYLHPEPELVGKTYKDVIFSYDTSSVIGIKRAKDGQILINPPMDTLFDEGDEVIAISEDDDTIKLSGKTQFTINQDVIDVKKTKSTAAPENNVILGWNDKGERIIKELEKYVAPGSKLMIIAEGKDISDNLLKLQESLKKQQIEFISDDFTKRSVLNKLDFSNSQNVIILSYKGLPAQEADAKTLITLLHLRSIAEQYNTSFNIVSEMNDIKNRKLAEVAKADDFIIGDNLISLILAQLSECKDLENVFDCLFNAEGSEIYLNPASDYIKTGIEIDYYTVLEAAAQKGETAIGYRLMDKARDPKANYGVCLNPKKTDRFSLGKDDKIVVIAEN